MNTLTSPSMSATPQPPGPGAPWWRFPIVWLVVGGPLIVVPASLFMVGIAVRHVDPVLDVSVPAGVQAAKSGHVPAMVGRNRAAETATQPGDH